MSPNQISGDDLAARLYTSAGGVYAAEMAVGILLTPTAGGATLADLVRHRIRLAAGGQAATVEWPALSATCTSTLSPSPPSRHG